VLKDNKVGKLLDFLECCGPKAYDGLVKALRETMQEDTADILTEAVTPNNSRAADGNI